jgi:hypothetical protein
MKSIELRLVYLLSGEPNLRSCSSRFLLKTRLLIPIRVLITVSNHPLRLGTQRILWSKNIQSSKNGFALNHHSVSGNTLKHNSTELP